jgi:uncharacterized protein (TIGR02001 family)
MRIILGCLSSVIALAAATPALADEAPAETPAITINGTATLVSDYRFRGVSQTDKNFAVQGSLTLTHESGFYVSVWGSSVDSYVTASLAGHQEIDIIGGFKKTVGGTTFDIGALYYFYPKTKFAGDVSSSDFIEPYLAISHTFGPVTAKGTVNWAPKQKALSLDQVGPSKSNVYLAGDLSAAIPGTPISLSAHLGHNFGPSWLATDSTGKKEYSDWGLGASVTWKALTLGVQYVDTDAKFVSLSGSNVSKGGIVGSIGVSF